MIIGYKYRSEEWRWHRWFAWRPVPLIDQPGIAWLQVVERTRTTRPGVKWVFREKQQEANDED
ncbi:hypothetical protein SAMN05216198_1518 [Halopseudomonas litoralis]|uniref:Uncharacterized protein n=1 Tax=Halopseudomonas litoralis TaxID=797277 RepID=A0A1H1QL81_9GAMM|nr:hypothetical protein [Halopseudomonas litoralis]SDS24251.1 hypothetical protein SAMN05216198_1518 [Halopseudomonas litoralis]